MKGQNDCWLCEFEYECGKLRKFIARFKKCCKEFKEEIGRAG